MLQKKKSYLVDIKRLVDLWVSQCNAVRTVKVGLDTRLVEGLRTVKASARMGARMLLRMLVCCCCVCPCLLLYVGTTCVCASILCLFTKYLQHEALVVT
jgi:hypothetical protein